ncbi:cytochrome c peroxidase [uncultured Pseudoteredinibacter sp.]|uniref:cytochrome-c peroxidase n=1 Tax=uncultured Pseudoteredinibacter sp. TaxID=1641701 RepID=UPI0026373C09|nr:cytochrome c peroxidase [uncultured Pseudoteredinibacter sp.]
MKKLNHKRAMLLTALSFVVLFCTGLKTAKLDEVVYMPGHPSLQQWLLPDVPPQPEDNRLNDDRIALGKALFFDPRLSQKGNMSCATCHNPSLGWSDGLPTSVGHDGKPLGRASPTVINTAFNSIQMWDGRKKTLEDQAIGPMESGDEMATDIEKMFSFLRSSKGYQAMFEKAYPGEEIGRSTLTRAIASFERTVISNQSPFDRWVKGDKQAMSAAAINGFKLFMDRDKGNCAACHSGANFTDNGFHNLGLASFADNEPDLGRFSERPLRLMKGAFKTPTLRDVSRTAPYFHDGSAPDLAAVVDHYALGGVVTSNLSPNMKALTLSAQEKADIVTFMEALTSPMPAISMPELPQ